MRGRTSSVAVVGQIGRDLVLAVDALPDPGGSAAVTTRVERLGGKGANQAVGLRQLGADVTLIGVVGSDPVGDRMLDDAVGSGLDVSRVVRRGATALLVDVVTADGKRRLLEDIPGDSLLTAADVERAADALAGADTVSLQLQQPADALLAAARLAAKSGARIVLDGAVDEPARSELLRLAHVVRADAAEATLLTGTDIGSRADAATAAEVILDAGPAVVALAVPGEGNLVAWRDGSRFFPHGESAIADATGAGDAFVAGLVTGLRSGAGPEGAGRLAAAAASSTVLRLGGRPDLSHLGGTEAEPA